MSRAKFVPWAKLRTGTEDDLLWTHKPLSQRRSSSGEHQWTLLRAGKRFTCELRSHGEYGWEAQFFDNEEFFYGRRFDLKAQAAQWAELEKVQREGDGWVLHKGQAE